MSDPKKDKKEQEWGDSIPDEEQETDEDVKEKTYRDGSAVNECWADKEYTE